MSSGDAGEGRFRRPWPWVTPNGGDGTAAVPGTGAGRWPQHRARRDFPALGPVPWARRLWGRFPCGACGPAGTTADSGELSLSLSQVTTPPQARPPPRGSLLVGLVWPHEPGVGRRSVPEAQGWRGRRARRRLGWPVPTACSESTASGPEPVGLSLANPPVDEYERREKKRGEFAGDPGGGALASPRRGDPGASEAGGAVAGPRARPGLGARRRGPRGVARRGRGHPPARHPPALCGPLCPDARHLGM